MVDGQHGDSATSLICLVTCAVERLEDIKRGREGGREGGREKMEGCVSDHSCISDDGEGPSIAVREEMLLTYWGVPEMIPLVGSRTRPVGRGGCAQNLAPDST